MDYTTHVDCIGILFVFSGSIIWYLLFNLLTSFSLLFLHNNFLNSFSSALKFLSVIPSLIKSYFNSCSNFTFTIRTYSYLIIIGVRVVLRVSKILIITNSGLCNRLIATPLQSPFARCPDVTITLAVTARRLWWSALPLAPSSLHSVPYAREASLS